MLPPSRARDREVWVGVFVILGVAAVIISLFTLTDAALFRGRYKVQTIVKDAGGIRRGDPVQMRGVNIGRVMTFKIVPEGVAVTLEIEGEYLIPADSKVELRSSGLLGGMVANVDPGASEQDLDWGGTLPGTIGVGVFDQIDELQGQADQALIRVQKLLDEQTIQNVHEGGQDLRQLLRQLNEVATQQRGELAAISGSLRRSVESLEKTTTGPQLSRAAQRIDVLTEKLDSTAASLARSSRSAESILARMDRGEGTLGKLSTDTALYDRAVEAATGMKKAAEELSGLAADIRTEPKKFVHLSIF
ncbi:MAG: MCE family protein [Candidatus Latescibacteria bacterium]|nr:MCE family protein [Candidatus Latescibacterota bacterium]